jgi:hypothetical protein
VSSATPDHPADATPDGDGATPDAARDEHLLVDPRQVRRAPKYGAFLMIGAVVGIAAGLWLGTWLVDNVDPRRGDLPVLKPGVFMTVVLAATTSVTVLLAGLVAVLADRRSLRRR